jgi:hypothetical protein
MQYCADRDGADICHYHVMGFARMVAPLVTWVANLVA